MNQSINTDSKNSKEPQQKYRLGTVSIKILGGLNRFYRFYNTIKLHILHKKPYGKVTQTPDDIKCNIIQASG